MMNIFDSLKKYAAKWECVETREFNATEIAYISKVVVVVSEYGLSAECTISGTSEKSYIPLDTNSLMTAGEIVDLTKCVLKTLRKEGEDDIYRLMERVEL